MAHGKDESEAEEAAAASPLRQVRGERVFEKRGRENLYKTLSPGAQPLYETICKLIEALGVKLRVTAA